MTDTVLVLGATGKTGRRLVPRLVAKGVTVRAASRHPGKDGTLFDWDRPETHGPALAGVDAVYLVGPEMVEDPTTVTGPFLERAEEAGVTRVVVLSALDVGARHPDGRELGYRNVERQVMGSRLDWTILQPTAFAQNFSEGFLLPGILEASAVVAPTGDGAVAFIDADDIAAVAAAALTEDGHAKAEYPITGPEALTFADAARLISEATGRAIAHQDISSGELTQILQGAGMPTDVVAMVVGTHDAVRNGRAALVTGVVEQVTGQPATTFADFARHAAAAWSHS